MTGRAERMIHYNRRFIIPVNNFSTQQQQQQQQPPTKKPSEYRSTVLTLSLSVGNLRECLCHASSLIMCVYPFSTIVPILYPQPMFPCARAKTSSPLPEARSAPTESLALQPPKRLQATIKDTFVTYKTCVFICSTLNYS
jgi:hypothetical protein